MFLAAGLIYKAYGHDRIAGLAGAARDAPLSVLAFAAGGVALMGVLPSGAYLAKKLLQSAADSTGLWGWDWVLQAGGFLTTSYVVLVVAHALGRRGSEAAPPARVPRRQEIAALALALASFALALLAVWGPLPAELVGSPFAPKELLATLATIAVGTVLALALSRQLPAMPGWLRSAANVARPATLALGGALERIDAVLRRWPVAGLSLLLLALLFGTTMGAG
jgi:NADH:ubiquinone oxidoreductase subunit 5 (subunit L)/multisubunit Na+/H+ antiporter MnhA subunit